MAYSFTTSGSTPSNISQTTPSTIGSTPVSKALNLASFGQPQPAPVYKPPVAPTAPTSQSVKSHTVNSDGSVTQTYHPPTDGMLSTAKPQTNTSTNVGTYSSFPGLISSLSQNSLTQSPVAGTAAKGLIGAPDQNAEIAKKAEEIRNLYGGQISKIGNLGAGAVAGDLSTGTNVVGSGNAAIASQSASARMNALANDEAQQINALNPQLTAQAQGQSGLTSAGNLGNTAQGQLQSGLTSAANLAQPNPTAYGQTVFNPLQAGFTEGGGLPPEVMQQYAQMAANGQIASIPSSITSNPVLSAQLNAAAKALNPNYTPTTSAAHGASAADLTTQASQIQANANGAEANFKLLVDTAAQGGVNSSTVPALNTLQNNVSRGLTSSEAVTLFRNTLNTVRNQYATILGGGTATDMSRGIASEQIPDDVSLSALKALETQLKSESANRVAGLNQQIKSLTGGNTTSGSTGGVVQTSIGPINTNW